MGCGPNELLDVFSFVADEALSEHDGGQQAALGITRDCVNAGVKLKGNVLAGEKTNEELLVDGKASARLV